MKATHKYTEGKTNRQIANMALKAMSNIQELFYIFAKKY